MILVLESGSGLNFGKWWWLLVVFVEIKFCVGGYSVASVCVCVRIAGKVPLEVGG